MPSPKAQDPINNPKMTRTVWEREIAFAEQYNEPGRFTAFIGFEWTSIATMETPGNLHRVVIFKDGGDKAGQVLPFSAADSNDPEKLWDYLAAYEEKTGGSVLAIAHNGNVSNGQMFPLERLNGQPIDRAYAETRMRWEPLYEVTQMKGDGEAHPFLSPNDEFADYGTWDKGDIAGLKPKEDWMLQYEYARTALQVGLQQEQKLGVNPLQVRHDREHRRAHLAGHHPGREQLEQDPDHGAVCRSLGARRDRVRRRRRSADDLFVRDARLGARRGLGPREHPRGALRSDAEEGNLRHDRHANHGAFLRRLGLRRG